MKPPVHIVCVEDRADHLLQARVVLHRLGAPVKLYAALTIIEGEALARRLLDPRQALTVAVISDMYLPFGPGDDGLDGTYLLNLLADEMRAGRLAQGILIGLSSELTPERLALGRQATAELWAKPLTDAHLERLRALLAQGPPWVAGAAPDGERAAGAAFVRDAMSLARRLWLRLHPDEARRQGKAILGILSRAIELSADEYREGLLLVEQQGGASELRAFLRAHPGNDRLASQDRRFFLDLLDGESQAAAGKRALLTRRGGQAALARVYEHISTLVLSKK